MGIIDFVTGGAKRMMIARPDAAKSQVVYKHPDQTFPFWSQLTVDSDEVCLFFKDGQFKGLLSAGRHTLDTQNIPFLNNIVNRFTGGNVFISELFFVTVSPIYNEGFGGPLGSMRDPELDLRVNPRVFGTYSFRIVDPTRFVIEFWRQRGGDSDAALQWVRDEIVMGVKTTLTNLIKSGDLTMMDLGTAGPDVARAIVLKSPDLAGIGIQLLEIAKLNINLSEEDQARIDEFQDQIVQAKIDARKAKITVARAEAEAQARQYALDQDFANRARYVNQVEHGTLSTIRGRGSNARTWAGACRRQRSIRRRGRCADDGRDGTCRRIGGRCSSGTSGVPASLPSSKPNQAPGPYPHAGYAAAPSNTAQAHHPSRKMLQRGWRAPAFCSGCGTPASGKFCSNCGQPLGV